MNYTETLNYLYSLQKTGIKFGLENTIKLLSFLGNPHKKFKSIHIAGTNGKGSTSSLIASIFSKFGYKVGLYTSPHLVRFNERIKVDNQEINDDYLVETVRLLHETIEKIKPTFFEVTTAIAFKYFADQKVDYAVIETGLGGRLDSTNVILPEASVITKIDFDHKEFLGDTLEKIAFEKGGIIKNEIPVVVAKNVPSVKNVLRNIAQEKNSRIIFTDENLTAKILEKNLKYYLIEVKSNLSGNNYIIKSPLIGDYQVENILNAIATTEILLPEKNLFELIPQGIEEMKFAISGRFQVLKTNPLIVLDTAHNSDAIKNFLSTLNSLIPNKKVAVFGIMKDKQVDDVINTIEKSFEKIYLCQAKIERAMDVNSLREKFSAAEVEQFKTVSDAINKAIEESKQEFVIVVFGSNFIVGEAIEHLNKIKFV